MNTTPTGYYSAPGLGVAPLRERVKPAIMRRIEALGKLNDRRVRYVDNMDRQGLIDLADEYECLKIGSRYNGGCPRMAAAIRKEAQEL